MICNKVKKHVIFFSCIILTSSFNCFSQTQAEMNQEAYDQFNKSDRKLNEIYQVVLSQYKNDSIFIQNLKSSQRLWIQFRDAELKMKFPYYPNKHNGTIQPICRAVFLMELTDDRIENLITWINGTAESDICNGSVKINEEIDPAKSGKAIITKDSLVWMNASMNRDHRIFGYQKKDTLSKKMILLSIFTNDVENNPFNCEYGAYYDSSGMKELDLKYLSTEGEFHKIAITKKGKIIDKVYMQKKWFNFEEE